MFNNSVVAVKSEWIEQQAPILDAQFFSWFIQYFISSIYNQILQSKTDVGHDFTWCGAAKLWNEIATEVLYTSPGTKISKPHSNPACAVIIGSTAIVHKDFRTINDWRKNTSGCKLTVRDILIVTTLQSGTNLLSIKKTGTARAQETAVSILPWMVFQLECRFRSQFTIIS